MPEFFTRYGKKVAVQLEFDFSQGLTEQHHKDDCDLNIIVKNYVRTGQLPTNQSGPGVFGDFSGAPEDYAEAVRMLDEARTAFAALPSNVRKRFNNDPQQLFAFLDNPDNRAEAEKLGLVATVTDDAPETRNNDSNEKRVPGAASAPGATGEPSGEASNQ